MSGTSSDDLVQKFEELLPAVKQVNEQFRDAVSNFSRFLKFDYCHCFNCRIKQHLCVFVLLNSYLCMKLND